MTIKVRKGQGPEHLSRDEFRARFLKAFADPRFSEQPQALQSVEETAWKNYSDSRKSPQSHAAGPDYAKPDYELSDEWRATAEAIGAAERKQKDRLTPTRVLLVVASPRNDKSCPGENSKTYRLALEARAALEKSAEVDVLDLSLLTSEFGRVIYPCKACVSTAMPLCHWPCSCYPNHSLGQTRDWMNEIYPRWAAAHGIYLITPVHWGQAPSVLKLLLDRLVCADGGNPDPTSTEGKKPELAKALEEKGWNYPKHLGGRAYSLLVHGDTEGVDQLQNTLNRWFEDLHFVRAADFSRMIGYYESYARSHEALDKDKDLLEEVREGAIKLLRTIDLIRSETPRPQPAIDEVRPK